MSEPPSKISLCVDCDRTFTRSSLLPSSARLAELLQLLRQNWSPACHHEISVIDTRNAAIGAEIKRHETELDNIYTRFWQILEDRDALQRLSELHTGIVTPIRRLPREILAKVFEYAQEPKIWSEDPVPADSWDFEVNQDLQRVAGGNLVAISQVCTHWRQVVLGTPTLWSNVPLNLRCWTDPVEEFRTSRAHDQIVRLLEAALARGKEVPISVEMNAIGESHPVAIRTMATSAHRWRSATFTVDSGMLINLSAVAGNLPLLETFKMNVLNESPDILADLARLLSSAPRLHTVDFGGPLSVVAHWPVEQLQCCTFNGLGPEDLQSLVSFMGRLPKSTMLFIELNFEAIQASPLDLTPVVSPIEDFGISAMEHTGHQTHHVLGQIFKALTLPNMQRLYLHGVPRLGKPVYWPRVEGMRFLHRSESRKSLTSLTLHDVVIAEVELLECLAELPQLLYLFISDHPAQEALPDSPPHHLVTDSLLEKLTPRRESSATCLVPNLMIVDFKTLGIFNQEVFLQFALQRTMGRADTGGTFECALLWVPRRACQLSQPIMAILSPWMVAGRLILTSREYDPNEDDDH
ncbi:hypothetical protein B0H12DRAFT_1238143 [Mycena haematopus]|nr:hypothetical protein B0H12DRAFT_1238143 [Mycena haematopus]